MIERNNRLIMGIIPLFHLGFKNNLGGAYACAKMVRFGFFVYHGNLLVFFFVFGVLCVKFVRRYSTSGFEWPPDKICWVNHCFRYCSSTCALYQPQWAEQRYCNIPQSHQHTQRILLLILIKIVLHPPPRNSYLKPRSNQHGMLCNNQDKEGTQNLLSSKQIAAKESSLRPPWPCTNWEKNEQWTTIDFKHLFKVTTPPPTCMQRLYWNSRSLAQQLVATVGIHNPMRLLKWHWHKVWPEILHFNSQIE